MGFLVRQVVFAASDDEAAALRLHEGPETGIVCDPGIVAVWNLEAIMTGRGFDDVMNAQPDPVAIFNEGQRFVASLGDEFRDGIAGLRGWRGARTVHRWARSDEVRLERFTPGTTFELVLHLRDLARSAIRDGRRLYFWVDVDESVL